MNKFLIFTSGRSGSNYLSNTLNLSPSCVCYGEVLGEWNVPYKVLGKFYFQKGNINSYLDLFYSSDGMFYIAQFYSFISHAKGKREINFKFKNSVKAIGLKDFLVTIERKDAFGYFLSRPEIKIIYLHRDNLLKRYISGLFMKESNIPVTYTKIQHNQIDLDIELMFENLKVLSDEAMREQQFIDKLKGHEILDIDYEEYFNSAESINKWNHIVCEFLGIKPIETTSKQKKILPNTLKDILLNYDLAIQHLEGTEYEKFLY